MIYRNYVELILLAAVILIGGIAKVLTKKKLTKLDGLGAVNREGSQKGLILK